MAQKYGELTATGLQLFGEAFLDGGGEPVVESVGLLDELLADAEIEGPLVAFRGADPVAQIVEKIHGFVEKGGYLVGILAGLYRKERGAVVHKRTDHILDVFFNVAKIHIILC